VIKCFKSSSFLSVFVIIDIVAAFFLSLFLTSIDGNSLSLNGNEAFLRLTLKQKVFDKER
jgi:hypothetical protein